VRRGIRRQLKQTWNIYCISHLLLLMIKAGIAIKNESRNVEVFSQSLRFDWIPACASNHHLRIRSKGSCQFLTHIPQAKDEELDLDIIISTREERRLESRRPRSRGSRQYHDIPQPSTGQWP